jgi:hypothetical protein
MPDVLDYTRFALPDFAPGQEQRMADIESRICQQDAKIRQLLFKHLDESWTPHDLVLLCSRVLGEIVETCYQHSPEGTAKRKLFEAYRHLDDVERLWRDKEYDHANA